MFSFFYLKEIKLRFIYSILSFLFSFLCIWFFSDQIIYLYCLPLRKAYFYYYGFSYEPHFFFTEIHEPLICRLLVSLSIPFYCLFFFSLFQFWKYIENSLFFYERKLLLNVLFSSCFLFFLSNSFLFFIILPVVCKFFISLEVTNTFLGEILSSNIDIHLETKLYPYVLFVIKTNFWFNFFFQLPIMVKTLIYMGWLDYKTMVYWRKFFYLLSILLSAFIAIDIITQIILFLLFFFFYEILILYSIFIYNDR